MYSLPSSHPSFWIAQLLSELQSVVFVFFQILSCALTSASQAIRVFNSSLPVITASFSNVFHSFSIDVPWVFHTFWHIFHWISRLFLGPRLLDKENKEKLPERESRRKYSEKWPGGRENQRIAGVSKSWLVYDGNCYYLMDDLGPGKPPFWRFPPNGGTPKCMV